MSENLSPTSESDVFSAEPPPPTAAAAPAAKRNAGALLRDNALMIAMPIVTVAVLYVLSLRGGPAVASAEQLRNERQVESVKSALSSKSSELSKLKTQTILDTFYHEAKQRQIPLEMVKGNPFIFKAPEAVADGATTKAVEIVQVTATRPVDSDLNAAMAAVKQLNLQSVLTGGTGRPIATISNNLLSEGQVVSGWTVEKIAPTEVTLRWRDKTYVLEMKE